MSNKNQNGPAMIKKITLIMLSIIFLHMNTYAYYTITTKNNKTDLGGKCESSITYQDGYFITSDGTKPSTIQLKNCSPTATNKICRIAYFKSGNGTCTFPFDHQKQTLSAVTNNNCNGDVYAFWVRSNNNNLYKININNGATAYFDCETDSYTTPTRIEKDCVAGYTFSHYSATTTRTNGNPCTSSSTLDSNQTIESINYPLSGECPILLLTVQTKKCPKGYYCPEGNCFENKIKCPAGHTTDGTGADEESDCKITTGTEFCDINGCFTLNDL